MGPIGSLPEERRFAEERRLLINQDPVRSRSDSSDSDNSNETVLSSPRSIPDEHYHHFGEANIEEEKEYDQYISNYQCIMKGITWARDSHGLFDYETRHPLKKQMKTETSQQLIRTARNNDLHILPQTIDYKEAF